MEGSPQFLSGLSGFLSHPLTVWGFLFLGLFLFVISTIILEFHWQKYGKHVSGIISLRVAYYLGAIPLLVLLIASVAVIK